MSKIIGWTFHAPVEVYRCDHCGKEYKSQGALDKHVDKEHPEPDPADD